jgi:hypothetical protein
MIRFEEARYDHRLHGVLLVSQGLSCYEVEAYLKGTVMVKGVLNQMASTGHSLTHKKQWKHASGWVAAGGVPSLSMELKKTSSAQTSTQVPQAVHFS